MTIIYFLISCSILIALVFLAGFIWSVRSGQYDDPETPAIRMLLDDPVIEEEKHDPSQKMQ